MPEKEHIAVGAEVRQLWEKGYDCLEKKNYDYAIELLNMALEQEPYFFDCRMALRAAQVKKHENAGRFSKMAAAASNAHHLAQAKLAVSRKNNFSALTHAEKILNDDPDNATAHRVIVDAAHALDMPQTMISSLQMLKRANPEDKELAQELAEALEMLGDWDTAEQLMLQLANMNPDDAELQQAYRDTAAKATIYRGSYGAQAQEEENEFDEPPKTAEEALDERIWLMEEQLQDEPENIKLAVDIAKLYVERQDFDRAFEYYDWVRESTSTTDSSIAKAIAEAQEARYNFDITQHPEGSEEAVQLAAERDAYMLGDARERADRFPTMLEFRFELGERLFNAGEVNDAILAFQKTQNSPPHKYRSLVYLGRCFMDRSMYDMAIGQFEKALEGKTVFDDEKKEILYLLGLVYEHQGRPAEAAANFKAIYEVDIGYRDVASKVESGY